MRACAVLCRSPGEGGPGLGAVVEGEHLGADDLVGLMTLAGDDDHVAGAGPAERALDGGLPVRKCLMPVHHRATRDARQDVGDDRLGRLAPRVVRGDPDAVAEARGDGAHERALAAVPVAAAAEDHREPPAGGTELLRRLERPLEGIGGVRVVHDDEEGLSPSMRSKRPGTEPTEPSARPMASGVMPRVTPTPAAARRFITLCSPTSGEAISRWPAGVRTLKRIPSAPEDHRAGRTSARPRIP